MHPQSCRACTNSTASKGAYGRQTPFPRRPRIHGDLSAYNILFWDGKIQIIDFGRAVDPRHNPGVFSLLQRDIARVHAFFAPYGVTADPNRLAHRLWNRYQRGTLHNMTKNLIE
jgi:serine/threonine-protein kinase RIO1